ncbi:hypothetical protein IR083_09995 [Dysgonomonas sp. GY75]|uniref:hypothetical protein n=1 Tax=Dysgonomonas sp. GY75 TaxID=2780419 RepID=UPI0018842D72|nr:hypothetical protein [Dysgonomonas sp. GY75]MBF0649151.1 hypothetical protein [Dysgonomonas sp. GY75]
MKKPDLSYNNYFPFYTRNITGEKKYYYCVETVMHISRERGIIISLKYERKEIKEICIERLNDSSKLYNAATNHIHISYIDFAKEVSTAYRYISAAVKKLSPEPAYHVTLVFSTYFKFNTAIELTVDPWRRRIKLSYGKFDYRIVDGKKVDNKEPRAYTDSEEDAIIKRIDATLRAYDDATTYQEIAGSDFEKRFDDEWDYFIQYFTAPKCIRKNEYRI